MARPAELNPRWLVGLLARWAYVTLHEQTRGIGWYKINPMLKEGIPTQAQPYDPTGYGRDEINMVEPAIAQLDEMRRLAVLRYFKPWMKAEIERYTERDPDTWMYHLRIGMAQLEVTLRKKTLDTGADSVINAEYGRMNLPAAKAR